MSKKVGTWQQIGRFGWILQQMAERTHLCYYYVDCFDPKWASSSFLIHRDFEICEIPPHPKAHTSTLTKCQWIYKGCMTLGHSNSTIWSPHKQFFPNEFSLFKRSHAAFPFPCRAAFVEPKSEGHKWMYDPGAFKLDHLQSTRPILHKKIVFFKSQMQHSPVSCMQGRGHS